MKLGFVSVVLDKYFFEEMIDFASELDFQCVMCQRSMLAPGLGM